MKPNGKVDMPWVIAQLNGRLFALNCTAVREMLIMPDVNEVAGVPGYVRGVINLRGSVIPLVDLRKRLGMRSSREEVEDLCSLLDQRRHDHVRWVEELATCVKEKRRFGLARDPHQCAFGKWFDTYKTNNILVSGFLKKFVAPHARVHALADKVDEAVGAGCEECAMKMLEQARTGELATMIGLFTQLQQLIRDTHREIAVVLHGERRAFAASVDSVASVERISPSEIEPLEGKGLEQHSGIVTGVAKRSGGQLVLVVKPDLIGS